LELTADPYARVPVEDSFSRLAGRFFLFRLCSQAITPPVAMNVIAVGPALPKTVGYAGGALQAADQSDDVYLAIVGGKIPFVILGQGLGRAAG